MRNRRYSAFGGSCMKGLIHIYTGEGKGKTTAAMGLALRAAGCGRKVFIAQFFKGRACGELKSLALLPNIDIVRLSSDYGFFSFMDEKEKTQVRAEHDAMLAEAEARVADGRCDFLILDEVISAYNCEALDRSRVDNLVLCKPESLELVLTGRDAPENLVVSADYITEMRKVKHPFDKGIPAREGCEF